jgi:hypothetical protein
VIQAFKQSLNHLIRPQQEPRRDREAEGLGGLQVDDQLERCRLLDWQIAGLGALEDLVDGIGRASPENGVTWALGDEASLLHKVSLLEDRR